MRTSQQLYNQIRWDPRFSPQEYVLGIRARRSQAIEELPITEFVPNGDIPWHRILYIKGPSGVVWDRSNRLDRLQPGLPRWGGAEQAAMQQLGPAQELDSLTLLTYNCCAGRNGLPLESRLRGLLNIIGKADYDLVALQEVGPEFLLELECYFEEQDETNPYAWLGGEHPSQLLLLSRLPVANLPLATRRRRIVRLTPTVWSARSTTPI